MRLRKDISKLIVNDTGLTLRGAMEVIDKGGLQIAIIVDSSGNLVAVLTDGDARRALLSGASLDAPALPYLNYKPVCCAEELPLVARGLASGAGVNKVIFGTLGSQPLGVFSLDGIMDELELPPVLVMAGGQGLRLRPITESKPKPLIEIAGKPILHRILHSLHESGFKNVYLSINYLGDQIKESVGDGSLFGLNVNYVIEQTPMGTAGSIGLISKIAPPETLLVMNADLVVDFDFADLVDEHERNENAITVVVKENITNVPFGVIRIVDGLVLGVDEKPSYTDLISAGVYCISGEITSSISAAPLDMPDLINSSIASGKRVGAFPIHRRWIDIGSHADLRLAQDTVEETF
jgi:dTDP-glucose pyrophosphorylase